MARGGGGDPFIGKLTTVNRILRRNLSRLSPALLTRIKRNVSLRKRRGTCVKMAYRHDTTTIFNIVLNNEI